MARQAKAHAPLLPTFSQEGLIECGCDEAGRGCLAGPVVAAAVILPIIEQEALAWGVGSVSPEEIDQINILRASFLAMHRAIDDLILRPQLLLIDGNRFTPYSDIPHECIVGGDGKYTSIAAASVLAKTHRDALMLRLATKYPGYALEVHKGYPTPAHKEAIRRLGLTPIHRKTFTIR